MDEGQSHAGPFPSDLVEFLSIVCGWVCEYVVLVISSQKFPLVLDALGHRRQEHALPLSFGGTKTP
jgi:hypothetical protein